MLINASFYVQEQKPEISAYSPKSPRSLSKIQSSAKMAQSQQQLAIKDVQAQEEQNVYRVDDTSMGNGKNGNGGPIVIMLEDKQGPNAEHP